MIWGEAKPLKPKRRLTLMKMPKSHPRYHSLKMRKKLVEFVEKGVVHKTGLIAHGRGEAFDYLLGEKTIKQAERAEEAAAAFLLKAENPVISVNGNTAALSAESIVILSKKISAKIEVNLFHRAEERIRRIKKLLEAHGGEGILGEYPDSKIPGLAHDRALCTHEGIFNADAVLLSLEDGDRTKALKEMGKVIIAIDLNPLSRTSRCADVTIVDDVNRAVLRITAFVKNLKGKNEKIKNLIENFNNEENLNAVIEFIGKRMKELASTDK